MLNKEMHEMRDWLPASFSLSGSTSVLQSRPVSSIFNIGLAKDFKRLNKFSDIRNYSVPCLDEPTAVKNLPANAGDKSSIPGLGKSLGEENDNPL